MAHTRARRPFAALVAVLATTLTITGLGVVAAGSASARKAPSLSASASQPVLNSTVALRGVANPKGSKVALQRLSGSAWVTVGTKKSLKRGAYSFNVKATSVPTSYRAVVKSSASRSISIAGKDFVAPAKTRTFYDFFDNAALFNSQWKTRDEGKSYGNRRCAVPTASMARIGGGVLTLSVRKTGATSAKQIDGSTYKCDGKSKRPKFVYQNAMIGTAEGNGKPFAQAYGTFAAKMKLQDPTGMHGSFWLQGFDASRTEIDVIEHFGTKSKDGLTTKLHQTVGGGLQTVTKAGLSKVLAAQGRRATDWNTYSVDWTPTGYTFSINGRPTFFTNRNLSGSQNEIVLSLLTSDWARGSLNKSSGSMQVDWVQAWAWNY